MALSSSASNRYYIEVYIGEKDVRKFSNCSYRYSDNTLTIINPSNNTKIEFGGNIAYAAIAMEDFTK